MLTLGCTAEQAEDAEDKAREVGGKAKHAGEELAEKAGDKTREIAGQASNQAKAWWADEVPTSGELSDKAVGLIRGGAESGGVEALVARGFQLAPVAFEVGKALSSVVDSDTVIEPIIQKVDDEAAQAELDAKIEGMPRVETIEGVSVGFKDMKQYDIAGRTSESAYLVLWRRDDRLLGFVYRSRKRIDIDGLIRATPQIYRMIEGAA